MQALELTALGSSSDAGTDPLGRSLHFTKTQEKTGGHGQPILNMCKITFIQAGGFPGELVSLHAVGGERKSGVGAGRPGSAGLPLRQGLTWEDFL